MKKNPTKKENKSLKAFFVYAFIVLFLIIISLGVKGIFLLRDSRYDGRDMAISVSQNNKSVGILGLSLTDNPTQNTVVKSSSYIITKKRSINSTAVGRTLGIMTEAFIDSSEDLSNESAQSILTKALLRSDSIKTNLTIFDLARLIFFAKDIAPNNQKNVELTPSDNDAVVNSKAISLFGDRVIMGENLTIQIINTTDITGLGKRLERAVVNKGGNVIDVSTQREKKNKSYIKVVNDNSYTSSKLKKLLNIPIEKVSEKSLADVVIIIGEDMKNATAF